MTPKDVMGFVRENLRDMKEPYRFSDELLLGFLNQSTNYISAHFKLPIAYFSKEITLNDRSIILPTTPLKILRALHNHRDIEIYTINTLKNNTSGLVFLDMQAYEPQNIQSGMIEIFYIPSHPAKSLEDTLALSDVFVDLLTFYICRRANQIETNAQNLQRVQFYDTIIKAEEDRLRRIVSGLSALETSTPYKII